MGGVGRELYVKRLIQTHAATQTNTNAKTKESAPHARTDRRTFGPPPQKKKRITRGSVVEVVLAMGLGNCNC